MSNQLVSASIEVYEFAKKVFLPTPSKPLYHFSIRDLSRLFQGIMKTSPKAIPTKIKMAKLFAHECLRTFSDRLSTHAETEVFKSKLNEVCSTILHMNLNFNQLTPLIFGDFMKIDAASEERIYDEIGSVSDLIQIFSQYLDDFNEDNFHKMNLIIFKEYAMQLVRVLRILRLDRGNGLVLGVDGIGKRSLVKLAAYISGIKCYQLEQPRDYDHIAFRHDLTNLYEAAGVNNEKLVFLVSDAQILAEEFLEDISNLLKTGEVPDLFTVKDLGKMLDPIRTNLLGLDIDENEVYDFFINRFRSNIHIILTMNPTKANFKQRCRTFPSLADCCTVTVFNEWPSEALTSIAEIHVNKIEMVKDVPSGSVTELSVLIYKVSK